MDLNTFTEKAQQALAATQKLAARLNHQQIEPEHLALALLDQEKGLAPAILNKAGVSVDALTIKIQRELEKLPRVTGAVEPRLTQRFIKLVDAKRLVAGRDRAYFKDIGDAVQRLRQVVPQASENGLAVTTHYFSVDGTVTFGSARVNARALLRRDPTRIEVIWIKEAA